MIHKREFAVVAACVLAGCLAVFWHPHRSGYKPTPNSVTTTRTLAGTEVRWDMPERVAEKEDRSWPGGKCLRCRRAEAARANVVFRSANGGLEPKESAAFGSDERGVGVLCERCWSECSAADRLDYVEQVTTGFLGTEPWPKSKRLAVLRALLQVQERTPRDGLSVPWHFTSADRELLESEFDSGVTFGYFANRDGSCTNVNEIELKAHAMRAESARNVAKQKEQIKRIESESK